MNQHDKINYVELPARDLDAVKRFFSAAFGWTFTDYGAEYTAFAGQGVDGGFFRAEMASQQQNGAALIVFYSDDIEATQVNIVDAGGAIIKPLFDFPGGRRFHFADPNGNEYAVWALPEGESAA